MDAFKCIIGEENVGTSLLLKAKHSAIQKPCTKSNGLNLLGWICYQSQKNT